MMSGGHDKSALGVDSGDYDMAGVASDVFQRMVAVEAQGDDFRIIYASPNSRPLRSPMRTTSIRISPRRSSAVSSPTASRPRCARRSTATTVSSHHLQETWKVVREVAEASGTPYNKAAYDAEANARLRRWRRSSRKQQQPAAKK